MSGRWGRVPLTVATLCVTAFLAAVAHRASEQPFAGVLPGPAVTVRILEEGRLNVGDFVVEDLRSTAFSRDLGTSGGAMVVEVEPGVPYERVRDVVRVARAAGFVTFSFVLVKRR